MGLTCNIDAQGKKVRFINGVVLLLAGVICLLAWPIRTHSAVGWIISIAVLMGGGFSIFQARAGWCIVRAMGFKTRV